MSEEIDNPTGNTGQRRKGRRKPVDGEIGIRYGSRNYIRNPGQSLISKKGKWHLVACPSRNKDGWHNFKVYRHEYKVVKNMWGIGLKNGAMARTKDWCLLSEYHPDVADWALEQAKLYAAGKLELRKEEGRWVIYRQGKGWMLYKGKANG